MRYATIASYCLLFATINISRFNPDLLLQWKCIIHIGNGLNDYVRFGGQYSVFRKQTKAVSYDVTSLIQNDFHLENVCYAIKLRNYGLHKSVLQR